MAGKIGDFAELTSPADGDLFEVVDVSDTTDDASGSTRRIAWSTFKAAFVEVSGDTMTGNLEVAHGANPRFVLFNSASTADTARFRFFNTASSLRIQRVNDDDSGAVTSIQIDGITGAVSFTGAPSVSVPDAAADGEALAYGQAGAELAGLVSTGRIEVSAALPEFRLIETDQAADQQMFRMYQNNGQVYMLFAEDSGTPAQEALRLTRAGGVVMSVASSVTVPDAAADGEALAHSQLGAVLGGLSIDNAAPILTLDETDQPADGGAWRFAPFAGTMYFGPANDAGTLLAQSFRLERNGDVKLAPSGGGSVTVPDATADGEALNRQTADARYGDRLWLSAADLNVTLGSPVLDLVQANRNVGWKMLPAGDEQLVAGSVVIPAGWSTYDVNVWWYSPDTTGDVVLRRRVYSKAPGDGGATGAGAVDTTATVAGVANDITSTTVAAATTGGVGGSAIAFIQVGRLANDAADTATSWMSILGVELVRVS